MTEGMRIGEVARRAGVTLRTIRYYHSIGLLPPGDREGHRQYRYTDETLSRLRKIDQLKKIGLSLEEIGTVIDLYFSDPSGVQAKQRVLAILRGHLSSVDEKIGSLQQFRGEVQFHIERFERWLAERGYR